MDEKKVSGVSVERLTANGVELPVVSSNANEEETYRVLALLDQLEEAEAPSFIISTATTWQA